MRLAANKDVMTDPIIPDMLIPGYRGLYWYLPAHHPWRIDRDEQLITIGTVETNNILKTKRDNTITMPDVSDWVILLREVPGSYDTIVKALSIIRYDD